MYVSGASKCWVSEIVICYQEAIEGLLETHGVKYVSTPRPGARRGGGTEVRIFFHMTKLNISIPKQLEVCFTLVRPRNPTGKITNLSAAHSTHLRGKRSGTSLWSSWWPLEQHEDQSHHQPGPHPHTDGQVLNQQEGGQGVRRDPDRQSQPPAGASDPAIP